MNASAQLNERLTLGLRLRSFASGANVLGSLADVQEDNVDHRFVARLDALLVGLLNLSQSIFVVAVERKKDIVNGICFKSKFKQNYVQNAGNSSNVAGAFCFGFPNGIILAISSSISSSGSWPQF